MSLRNELERYLSYLRATFPVQEMASEAASRDVIALRHDVDLDLDLALEMAYWEHRRGLRATYYLLDSAPYWSDERLPDKCLQMQDLGHEIGLHVNTLAKWYAGTIDDVRADLAASLDRLRSAGLQVAGIAPHGDPLCYEGGFANDWCFAELRPADPQATLVGLSAEGIPVSDPRFQLRYPADEVVRRRDGATFTLWSIRMRDLGIAYDAMHVPFDRYFTDSGGGWNRSPDPLTADLRRGRHQILIHPQYWRGPQRIALFLSTARAGSLWLSQMLERASSATARHELTLNYERDAAEAPLAKRTQTEMNELVADPERSRSLMLDAREWIEHLERDYAEANVYLADFVPLLREVFPEASMAHLHRDPRDVVRSLLNRDWYDTPEDRGHLRLDLPGWEAMSQFERACWYVRHVNERLIDERLPRLVFEEMVRDPGYLGEALARIGIAFYPRLAAAEYRTPLNVSYSAEFPPYDGWTAEAKATFWRICGPVMSALGYPTEAAGAGAGPVSAATDLVRYTGRHVESARRPLLELAARPPQAEERVPAPRLTSARSEAHIGSDGLTVLAEPDVHASVLLGGGSWRQIGPADGWAARLGTWYRGDLEAIGGPGRMVVYALMYDSDGKLLAQRPVAQIDERRRAASFGFRTTARARRFNLALYLPSAARREFVVRRITLEEVDTSTASEAEPQA